MSENTTNNRNVRDDEIDLLDLFNRMGRAISKGVKALWTAFLISVVFMVRRWLPLGLSIVVGFGASIFLNKNAIIIYTSDLVFRNNLAQIDQKKMKDITGTTAEIISKINILPSSPISLSEALSLDREKVHHISGIKAYWIIDRDKDGNPDEVDYTGSRNSTRDSLIRLPDRFDVQVSFDSIVNLENVRDGIVNFIENDSLNRRRNKLRQVQYRDILARVNFDIRELDSLQKVKFFVETRNIVPGKDAQIVFMQNPNTQLLYPDIQSLYAKRQSIEIEQNIYPGVITVLRGFSAPVSITKGTISYVKVIAIFFLATLIVLVLQANRKKLIEIYKKY